MIAVSDAGPLHYLILIGHAELLGSLFEEVLVPRAVVEELQHVGTPAAVKSYVSSLPPWLRHITEPPPRFLGETANLHAGEVEAIRLAHHRAADVVLIDDFAARQMAKSVGLKVAGTLRLLAEGSRIGLINLPEAFRKLKGTNFRANDRLYSALLTQSTSS